MVNKYNKTPNLHPNSDPPTTCLVCRQLASQLVGIDPSRLLHADHLSFWINIYNALLMHVSTSQTTLPPSHPPILPPYCPLTPPSRVSSVVFGVRRPPHALQAHCVDAEGGVRGGGDGVPRAGNRAQCVEGTHLPPRTGTEKFNPKKRTTHVPHPPS